MQQFDPRELTAEKSLHEIFRLIWGLRPNPFNRTVLSLFLIASITYVTVSKRNSGQLVDATLSLADTGLSYATQIIGFVLAGFTIFATLNKPTLFAAMAAVQYKDSKLSFLKQNFFTFVEVFVLHLLFTALCIIVLVFAPQADVPAQAINLLPANASFGVKRLLAATLFVIVSTSFFGMVLALKSLIFNIYHVVMTSIRWEIEHGELKGKALTPVPEAGTTSTDNSHG